MCVVHSIYFLEKQLGLKVKFYWAGEMAPWKKVLANFIQRELRTRVLSLELI